MDGRMWELTGTIQGPAPGPEAEAAGWSGLDGGEDAEGVWPLPTETALGGGALVRLSTDRARKGLPG